MSIVLASGSPRRSELLRMIGIEDFKVIVDESEELIPHGLSPEQTVCEIAIGKAKNISRSCNKHDTIIAADTLVYLDGQPLGKPNGPDDAESMLRALSGRKHTVYTGVALQKSAMRPRNQGAEVREQGTRDAPIITISSSSSDACTFTLPEEGNYMVGYEKTEVFFREITDEEISAYVKTGEPLDKAGAYGAQGRGAVFIERIEGDFFNVMGLPLCRLSKMLKDFGVEI